MSVKYKLLVVYVNFPSLKLLLFWLANYIATDLKMCLSTKKFESKVFLVVAFSRFRFTLNFIEKQNLLHHTNKNNSS